MSPDSFHLNHKLIKHLQLNDSEPALNEARELWREALSLIDVQTWDMLLDLEDFFTRFHPYGSESAALSKLLSGTHRVWLFAASLGRDLERRSKNYLKSDLPFRGFILDRIGSYIVEEKIKDVDKTIDHSCRVAGWLSTRRYSPGYRDFPLESQEIFLELINGNISDLELTHGFLLRPEKTITALKGVTCHDR